MPVKIQNNEKFLFTKIQKNEKLKKVKIALKMFEKSDTQKNSFLEQTKSARINRLLEKESEEKQNSAILIIQKNVRGFVARSKFNKRLL